LNDPGQIRKKEVKRRKEKREAPLFMIVENRSALGYIG
jgi:hypothetical protein